MKAELESLSNVKKKISIQVPEAEVVAEINGAYNRIQQKAQIPGFRKGKAPRPILEKHFAQDVEAEVYENLVRRTMVQALQDHKLAAVAMPEITKPKREVGSGFSYVASIEVKPQFDLKNYKGIKLKKPASEPKKEQIDEVMNKLLDAQSVLKNREGATKPVKGDFVSIVIQGIDAEGNLTSSSKEEPKEQLYEIGGEILHTEVEKVALKLNLGEAGPVTIKSALEKGAEKEFFVRVTLKAIKEKILPTMNDDFAKAVGPFESLKALKDRIVEDLKKEMEENGRGEMAQEVLAKLIKDNPIDLPPSLVDQELHQMIHNVWGQLERAGIKDIPEEYSEDTLHKKMHPDAERRVHEQLMIEAVAEKENIEVKDDEVTKRIGELAKAAKVPVAEFRAYYEKTNRTETIRFQLLAQKTIDFLLTASTIDTK